jgi:hypothetical protein
MYSKIAIRLVSSALLALAVTFASMAAPKVDATSRACSGVSDPGAVANCLLEAARAASVDKLVEPFAFLWEVYKDVSQPALPLSCDTAMRYLDLDLQVLSRGYSIQIPFKATNCETTAAVYQAVVGNPPRWTNCPDDSYSYERLEKCILPIFSENYAEQITKMWNRVTDNLSVEEMKFSFMPLPRALQVAKSYRDNIAGNIRYDAVECKNEDARPPRQLIEQYALLVASGATPGKKETQIRTEAASAVTCADAIQLATKLPRREH